ncbi:MAG: hypothetical protein EZS28_054763, partial [Streblomastix strix]
ATQSGIKLLNKKRRKKKKLKCSLNKKFTCFRKPSQKGKSTFTTRSGVKRQRITSNSEVNFHQDLSAEAEGTRAVAVIRALEAMEAEFQPIRASLAINAQNL